MLQPDDYTDKDFVGMYGCEANTDPVNTKSRTGYVITIANCPDLCVLDLQGETALSSKEAEVIALVLSCKKCSLS